MKEINDAFGNWLAGFVDGEGCFKIIIDKSCKSPVHYRCQFTIQLRDDDRQILNEIHDTLGIGTIHNEPVPINSSRNAQATTGFYVSAIADCAELVEMLEIYPLRAKKGKDFEIWKQAVAEMQKPVDCRDPLMLGYWFRKIKKVRQYGVVEELPKPIVIDLQLTITFK